MALNDGSFAVKVKKSKPEYRVYFHLTLYDTPVNQNKFIIVRK